MLCIRCWEVLWRKINATESGECVRWIPNAVYMEHTRMLSHIDSLQPWAVAHLAPLCMLISQARILEWVAIFYFRTQGSNPCLLRLLHWQVNSLQLNHLGSHCLHIYLEITLNLQEKRVQETTVYMNHRGSGYHSWTTLSYTTITEQ